MVSNTGRIYIVKRCGRLANRIIFYANIIAWAEEKKLKITNFTFQSYANLFESTHLTCGSVYPPHELGVLSKLSLPITNLLNSIRLQYQCIYLFSKVLLKSNLLCRLFPILSDHDFDGTRSLSEIIPEDYWLTRKTLFLSGWKFREPVLTVKHASKIRDFFKPIEKVRIQVEKSFPRRENDQWASFYGEKPLLHIYNTKEEFNRNSFQVSGISNIPG